ncbi:ABC transporter ATP-binding protein [Halobellus salinus]|uniref:ABC transporter ATP-binding protein n=1 Tax=Halobellus salinus TaxID=931585 RepID=A0A830ELB6_9EURY|nr:ABC transporter ATP-binding protein [Halobellus salinus]GGJ00257.1 ABC transporter ATP-binding protein [Halobellus salinus]SMP01736.1 amino acid/amide ABC transporter ATP-binding protein 2, HAAT family [Halobellus salinus]
MIELDAIDVSYGNIQVIWDLDLHVSEDDTVVSIVGPNGAGKSTLLRVMSGLHPVSDGRVSAWDADAATLNPTEIVERGFVHVSEERNLFGDMTVRENLEMGAYTHRNSLDDTMQEVFELFPILEERSDQLAKSMSGGQQQMLAIGRGLMAQPTILALDEPSEGLAPQITDRVFGKIEEISEEVTVLLVEQHVNRALNMAERAYLLENGRVVREDTGTGLLESDHVKDAYL